MEAMSEMNEAQPAMFALFVLLSETRRTHTITELSKRLAPRGVRFDNGIDFWIRLCRASRLLCPEPTLEPTPLCERWLSWGARKRISQLLAGWCRMICCAEGRRRRQRIVDALKGRGSSDLIRLLAMPSYQREIRSITALGLFDENRPSAFARKIFSEHPQQPPSALWEYNAGAATLLVPLPPRWKLLWTLESLLPLPPDRQGNCLIYPLDLKTLRWELGRDLSASLLSLLEEGLGKKLPKETPGHPPLTARKGFLLTCCDSDTLIRLRGRKNLGDILMDLVGPNHVFVPENQAPRAFCVLAKSKLAACPSELHRPKHTELHPADQGLWFALLRLVWYAQIRALPYCLSTDQLQILCSVLPRKMTLLAMQQGEKDALRPSFVPDDASPLPSDQDSPKIQRLRQAIHALKTVRIQYQKPDQEQGKVRRIAPLLIEMRGEHRYLIAFCEKSCERRTFRIDRISAVEG
jgi:hypothetical protein